MSKEYGKIKKIACLTPEQQSYYESLNNMQRKYVDYRSAGYNKTQSYQMAGYSSKNAGQSAFLMERANKGIVEIVEARLMAKKANSIKDPDSVLNMQIDALAQQKTAEQILETIDGADAETAQRIKFYRDVVAGKIKSIRKTTTKDATGAVKSVKIEEIDDVDLRMKARRELDRVLGLNTVADIGQIDCGDITINIVDASKKDEIVLPSEQPKIENEEVVEVEGEKVAEESSKKDKFFETVGEGG